MLCLPDVDNHHPLGMQKCWSILIHGGSGRVWSIAIQLANNLTAYVATTVSIDDKRSVEMLGADEVVVVVVDFRTDFRDFLYGYHAVFDIIGGETYAKSFYGGIIVSMLEQPNAEIMECHGTKAISQSTQVNSERLTKLAQWADQII
jgi:alcohol dehydrogenase